MRALPLPINTQPFKKQSEYIRREKRRYKKTKQNKTKKKKKKERKKPKV